MISMNEYIIVVGDKMATVEKDGRISLTKSFGFATKFKVKQRALKVVSQVEGGKVVPSFGGFVHSTKNSVTPKQSPINKSQPYRSV